jgi:D-glycero-D-manno-heptose 1,7-bisphosphate phosphatase
MGRAAIFLDRDGVINENLAGDVRSWADFRFLPGTLDALRELTSLDSPIFLVTNQAVIGRGQASQQCVDEIHARMLDCIRAAGARVTEVLCCPHLPSAGCHCRKPAPGMLLEIAARFDIDLGASVLVGDWLTDIAAGQRGGCRTILVLTGRGAGALQALQAGEHAWPTAIAADLPGAVPTIISLLATRQAPHEGLRRPGMVAPASIAPSPQLIAP